METVDTDYPAQQALSDAATARVGAARLLTQPARFHVARGVLAAMALAIFAMDSLWASLGLVVLVIAGMTIVDRLAARATGAQPGAEDLRRFWPANQRVVLVVAFAGIITMAVLRAMNLSWPVRLAPAVVYGIAWTLTGIHGDRARLQTARAAGR